MYQSNGCTGRLLQLLKWLHHQNRDQHEQDKPAMNFSKINFSVIGLFFSFLCLKDLIAKNFGLELSLLGFWSSGGIKTQGTRPEMHDHSHQLGFAMS